MEKVKPIIKNIIRFLIFIMIAGFIGYGYVFLFSGTDYNNLFLANINEKVSPFTVGVEPITDDNNGTDAYLNFNWNNKNQEQPVIVAYYVTKDISFSPNNNSQWQEVVYSTNSKTEIFDCADKNILTCDKELVLNEEYSYYYQSKKPYDVGDGRNVWIKDDKGTIYGPQVIANTTFSLVSNENNDTNDYTLKIFDYQKQIEYNNETKTYNNVKIQLINYGYKNQYTLGVGGTTEFHLMSQNDTLNSDLFLDDNYYSKDFSFNKEANYNNLVVSVTNLETNTETSQSFDVGRPVVKLEQVTSNSVTVSAEDFVTCESQGIKKCDNFSTNPKNLYGSGIAAYMISEESILSVAMEKSNGLFGKWIHSTSNRYTFNNLKSNTTYYIWAMDQSGNISYSKDKSDGYSSLTGLRTVENDVTAPECYFVNNQDSIKVMSQKEISLMMICDDQQELLDDIIEPNDFLVNDTIKITKVTKSDNDQEIRNKYIINVQAIASSGSGEIALNSRAIQDKAGYYNPISEQKNIQIINSDQQKPIIRYNILNASKWTNLEKKVTVRISDNQGLKAYLLTNKKENPAINDQRWIKITNQSASDNEWTKTFNLKAGNYYLYVIDINNNMAGRTWQVNKIDLIKPSLRVTKLLRNLIISVSDKDSGMDSYCISTNQDCKWLPMKSNGAYLVKGIKSSVNYITIKDQAGNIRTQKIKLI